MSGLGLVFVLAPLLLDETLGAHFGEHVAESQIRVVVFDTQGLCNVTGPMGRVRMLAQEVQDFLPEFFSFRLRLGVG
jgi:hypothetical protein